MVWVYEDLSLDQKERKLYNVIKQSSKTLLAERTVKLLNLVRYLKRKNFKTPKEIQESAFYDKKHLKPIFTDKSAKALLKALKMRGGASAEYPVTDSFVRSAVGYLQSWDPTPISGLTNSLKDEVVSIEQLIENNVPYGKLGAASAHAAIETGVSAANNIGELGSAPGAAIVMVGTVPAALAGAALATSQDNFGQAAVHLVNAVPVMGPPMVKAINKLEHLSTISQETGGKRFSTRRHNKAKWPRKTMRKIRIR
jgi:hypothetical protein